VNVVVHWCFVHCVLCTILIARNNKFDVNISHIGKVVQLDAMCLVIIKNCVVNINKMSPGAIFPAWCCASEHFLNGT